VEINRIRQEITQPWKQWVRDTIGISEQYAISKKFAEYKRLHFVAISFKELYSRRNDIWVMLQCDQELAAFWCQPKNTSN